MGQKKWKYIQHLNIELYFKGAKRNFIHSIAFWHIAVLLFSSTVSFTLYFSTEKASVEVPINKTLLQKKTEKKINSNAL